MIRIVWLTERRITNLIWELKGFKGNDTVLQMISPNVGPTTDININGTKPVQNEFSWSHSNNLYVNLSKCSVFNYETWLQKKF